MIKISCQRDRLKGQEKIRYARAIGAIIRELKAFQKSVKKERIVEVDYLIMMK